MQAETRRAKTREAPPLAPATTNGELETETEVETATDDVEQLEAANEEVAEPESPRQAATTVFRKPVARARGASQSTAIKNLHRVEDQSVVEWIKTLQGSGPIQIRVHRLKPAMHNGKNVGGHLTTIDDQISEDELRDQYGGGTYQLRIMRRSDNGSWVFLTSTSVVVAGDPRTDNLPKANPSETSSGGQMQQRAPDENPLLDKAFKFMERQVEQGGKGPTAADTAAQIAMMMKPFEMQMAQMAAQLAAKDAQLVELHNKPQNPFQEKLLDKMIDGDTARVTAVREQLMSENRQLRESAIADEKRLRDSFEREKDAMDRRNEREIANLKASHEQALSSIKMSFDTQKTLLDGEIRRYERDIAELRVEVKELRAKKDKTIAETVKEMDSIKELFAKEEDDDDKDKSTIEKVADIAMNSDRLFDFASKWVGKGEAAKPAAQQQQQRQVQQQRPPRVIRRRADGQVMVHNPETGEYEPVRRRRAADGAETDEVEPGVQISPEQIALATQMLELAYSNNMKPEVVATSASTQVPEEILQAIRTHGVDGFLQKVAKLSSASPLSTQNGINWCRKVGKALTGG